MESRVALMTADELLHLNLPHKRTELVRGRLIVREPAGWTHGVVAMKLGIKLGTHVERTNAGVVLAAETGFKLASEPDTVRAPDVAFVALDRIPEAPRGFSAFAPDLAVEVLSPDDRPGEVLAKIADWLEAGAKLVWVVDPARQLARVYRSDGSEDTVTTDGALEGEDLLPGFSCSLASLLP
ncbi:MAG TPA: Uma2 family endonuclease [Gemmatimonadales bacterium]|nr:Uma2 family endonuclease [Gemmatimonadales bacterium]